MVTDEKGALDARRYLLQDEQIVWSARPVRKYFLKYLLAQDPSRFVGYYFLFLGLVFVAVGLGVVLIAPSSRDAPPVFVFLPVGALFAVIGYLLSFGRRRRMIRLFANTEYYLTNKRALIVSGADRPTLSAIDLRRVSQISISLVDGTVGNVVFGEADPAIHKWFWTLFDGWAWWAGGQRCRLHGFIAINDAEDTMRRITRVEDSLR